MDAKMKEKIRFHKQNPQLGDCWAYDGKDWCIIVAVEKYAITVSDDFYELEDGKIVINYDTLQNLLPQHFPDYINQYANEVYPKKFMHVVTSEQKGI